MSEGMCLRYQTLPAVRRQTGRAADGSNGAMTASAMLSPASPAIVSVSPAPLQPRDVVAVAREGARVELSTEALDALKRARGVVDALAASGEPVYGVSTGFG